MPVVFENDDAIVCVVEATSGRKRSTGRVDSDVRSTHFHSSVMSVPRAAVPGGANVTVLRTVARLMSSRSSEFGSTADIAALGGGEAREEHAQRIDVGNQSVESETALLVGEGVADELIVAVVKIDGGAHLSDAHAIMHITQDLAGEGAR